MDREQIIHEISLISAKAICDTNLPEYRDTGVKSYAKDMINHYLEAYAAAKEELAEKVPKNSSVHVLK